MTHCVRSGWLTERERLLLIMLFIALSPLDVNAEILTFQGQETWSTWRAPIGLTQVGDEGQLQLTKFRRNINAVADAHEFTYESKSRGEVAGGLWEALSNPGTGAHIIDGDAATYWQPDPADEVPGFHPTLVPPLPIAPPSTGQDTP